MTRAPGSTRRAVRNVLLAILAVLVAAIALQAFWLGPLLSHELSRRSGRSVHVDSMWVGLGASLAPVLHFRGIRIDNAPWADSARPFVALGSATAAFSWRSIEEGRPVVALWTLRDGEVDLERQADGLRNWRLANPDFRGPGRWKVLAVQAERASVRFAHAGIDLDLLATASPSADADASRPTHIDLRGRWRKLPFTVSADTGPSLTFLETGQSFAVRGHLAAGGARLEVEGLAGDIVRQPSLDARVSLTAPSLAPFAAFIGHRQAENRSIRIEGALKAADGSYALSGTKAKIGATDLAGDLSWTRGDDRSVARAKLASESTDVADLRWLAGLAPSRARAVAAEVAASAVPARRAAAAVAGSAPAAVAASGARAERRAATDVDGELSFSARRLHAAELPALQSGRLEAALSDGKLTLSRLDLGVAQGHVIARGSVDLREASTRVDGEVDVTGLRVETFLRDAAGKDRLTGALQAHAALKTQGESVGAMRDAVSGRVTATLAGGTISSLLDAQMGLQGGKMLRSWIGGAEPIAIRCASATLDLAGGAARIRHLELDTERTRTTATGAIDFGRETIDVVLTPEAKQAGLFVLERSIRLHGPLRRPAHDLVARAPAASAPPARHCGRP